MGRWLNKVGSGYQAPMAYNEIKNVDVPLGNNAYYNPNMALCPKGPMGGQMVDMSIMTDQEIDACFLPTPSYIPFDNPSYEGDTHMDCYDCENKSATPERYVIGDHLNDDGTTGCPSGTVQSNLNINRTNQSTNPCVSGCTSSSADNFNQTANTDDGSCIFPEIVEDVIEEEIEDAQEEESKKTGLMTAGPVWYGLVAAVVFVIAKRRNLI